jgi:hypothetical protein
MKIEFKKNKTPTKSKTKKVVENVVDVVETNKDDMEIYRPSLKNASNQHNNQQEIIEARIKELTASIKRFDEKEKMLESMIDDIMARINAITDPMQFKKKSQLQNIYFRQIEIQAQLVDTKLKYENNLQTYLKMRTDTTNSYFRNYKTLSDVSVNDANTTALETLLQSIDSMFNAGQSGNKHELVELAELELEKEEGERDE